MFFFFILQENLLNEINNDDSSDSDGGDDVESSDEGEDFIFSGDEDEDGNIIGGENGSESDEEVVDDDSNLEDEDEGDDSYFIDEENDSEVEFESDEGDYSDSGNLTEDDEDDNNILRVKKPSKKIVKKLEVPTTSSSVNENKVKKVLTKKSAKKINAVEKFNAELLNDGVVKKKVDGEYRDDTSDEEDIRNTVGNIPMQWYDEYKHIGYDWDAKKIIKPAKRDQLDDFLKRMEDPNFWRTVKDPQTGQDIILSEADIDLIKRINSQRIPDQNFDEYAVSYKINFIYLTN